MGQIQLFEGLFSRIQKASVKKYYPVLLTLLLTCSSLFLAFPRYDKYVESEVNWETVFLKSNDLKNNLTHLDPNTWLAKKVFRLTVPVIIKIFHLNRPAVLVVQFVIGMLLLYYSYVLAKKLLNDSVSATFLASGLAFLYIGRTCFTDITATWFDGWAYFFLLISLVSPNAFMVFIFATMAAWVDERAIVILPAILIFHQTKNLSLGNNGNEFKQLITLRKESIALIGALIFTVGLRLYLTIYENMETPLVNVNSTGLRDNFFTYGFAIFTFFEGYWLLLPLLVYFAVKHKNYLFLLLVIGQLAVSTIGAMFVYDVTRSGSYMFPMLFVWLLYLSRFIPQYSMRNLLLSGAFFCLIFPPINYVSQWSLEFCTEKPMLYVLFKILAGS